MEALLEIPFELDTDGLLQRVHLSPGSDDAKEFAELVQATGDCAKPKAVYKESFIDSKGESTVTIDQVTFTSKTLRMNLSPVERVFPFVATCGREVDDTGLGQGDVLKEFWFETIKAALLRIAVTYLNDYLKRKYALGKTSAMSPGSGDVTVWPIEQQKDLFSLFGDVEEIIGVRLTDSFLMVPNKSVSGIRFPTEVDFRTCQVCRRENCPSRSAEFDETMWKAIRE
jgi:hypothetical protein